MIQKSKFIENIWFVEVPIETTNFLISFRPIANIYGLYLSKVKEPVDINPWILGDLKNPKGLFLTKLATEENWNSLIKSIEPFHYYMFPDIFKDLQSLLKAENLDNNKNYLIIKSDD